MRTTNFKVTKIPVRILKKFKKMCKEECGDVYWVGISKLLEIKEKHEEILSLFHALQNQIDELKKEIESLKKPCKEVVTFG